MQENPIKEYEIHLLEMWNKSRSYAHSFLALSERTQESNLIIDQIHLFDPLIKEFQQKKDERILYLLDKVL